MSRKVLRACSGGSTDAGERVFQAQLAAMELYRKLQQAKEELFTCEADGHLSVRRRFTGTAGTGKITD